MRYSCPYKSRINCTNKTPKNICKLSYTILSALPYHKYVNYNYKIDRYMCYCYTHNRIFRILNITIYFYHSHGYNNYIFIYYTKKKHTHTPHTRFHLNYTRNCT